MTTDRHSNLLCGEGMGSWKLTAAHTPSIICSSGVVAVQGKDDDATADFSLRYEWLKSEIEKHPEQSEYEMVKQSPVTLMKAITQNKLATLGCLEAIKKTVDVKYGLKRCYREVPQSGKELLQKCYKSEAWDISLVSSQMKGE